MAEVTVLRRVSWFVNATFLTLSCFLVARIANDVYEALHRPPPQVTHETPANPAPRKSRSGSDREVILTRNLFNASVLAPVQPFPPPEERIEETQLPLGLLGTLASNRSEDGWAAVWDADSRRSLVVQPGDEVGNGRAAVLRIERRRVLLSEKGATRELVFDDDGQYRPPRRPAPRRKAWTNSRRGGRRGGR